MKALLVTLALLCACAAGSSAPAPAAGCQIPHHVLSQRPPLKLQPLPVRLARQATARSLSDLEAHCALAALVGSEAAIPRFKILDGPLYATKATVRRGSSLTFVATQLPAKAHRAWVTLVGPAGYSAETTLSVRLGTTGALYRVPSTLRPGRYYLAVVDVSRAKEGNGHSFVAAMRLLVR